MDATDLPDGDAVRRRRLAREALLAERAQVARIRARRGVTVRAPSSLPAPGTGRTARRAPLPPSVA